MSALKFKDRIRIEAPGSDVDPDYGTPIESWVEVATVWAEIQDIMPSKSEATANGIRLATDSARVRIRHRDGITSDMRIVELTGSQRTLSIIGGPAAIFGRRELEMQVERFSS